MVSISRRQSITESWEKSKKAAVIQQPILDGMMTAAGIFIRSVTPIKREYYCLMPTVYLRPRIIDRFMIPLVVVTMGLKAIIV
jgi:hypothetical protein